MNQADLACLFQLGVGLNLGFGALVVFAEPARRQFRLSLDEIESRLLGLGESAKDSLDSQQKLFALNRAYMDVLAHAKVLFVEEYITQSVVGRLMFMLGALISFIGLVFCSVRAAEAAQMKALLVAIAVNAVPLLSALALLAISCWYQYKVSPRVENLRAKLFGKRPDFVAAS
jgi:hypothetical protein